MKECQIVRPELAGTQINIQAYLAPSGSCNQTKKARTQVLQIDAGLRFCCRPLHCGPRWIWRQWMANSACSPTCVFWSLHAWSVWQVDFYSCSYLHCGKQGKRRKQRANFASSMAGHDVTGPFSSKSEVNSLTHPYLLKHGIWGGGESYWNFILKFHFCNHAFSMINIPHHSMSLASRWKLNTCV